MFAAHSNAKLYWYFEMCMINNQVAIDGWKERNRFIDFYRQFSQVFLFPRANDIYMQVIEMAIENKMKVTANFLPQSKHLKMEFL